MSTFAVQITCTSKAINQITCLHIHRQTHDGQYKSLCSSPLLSWALTNWNGKWIHPFRARHSCLHSCAPLPAINTQLELMAIITLPGFIQYFQKMDCTYLTCPCWLTIQVRLTMALSCHAVSEIFTIYTFWGKPRITCREHEDGLLKFHRIGKDLTCDQRKPLLTGIDNNVSDGHVTRCKDFHVIYWKWSRILDSTIFIAIVLSSCLSCH